MSILSNNSFNYRIEVYFMELKKMKMEVQSSIYQQLKSFRNDNEDVNATINFKNKSTSQEVNICVIQIKYPQIPLDDEQKI